MHQLLLLAPLFLKVPSDEKYHPGLYHHGIGLEANEKGPETLLAFDQGEH